MKKITNIQEKIVPVSTTKGGKQGFIYKDTETGKTVGGFVEVSKLTSDQTKEISKYTQPGGNQGYKLDPGALKSAKPKDSRLDSPIAGPGPKGNEVGSRPAPARPSVATPAAPAPSRSSVATPAPARPSAATPAAPAPAPAAPKSSPVSDYMKAAAAARKSGDPAQMAKVRDMGMDIWRKSNPKLAAAADERARIRGTAQTDNPLMKDMRSRLPATPTVQAPEVKNLGLGQQSLSQNPNAGRSPEPAQPKFAVSKNATMNKTAETLSKNPLKKEAYDIVLDYLFSEGHADTLSEAHYVMLQMDAEHIRNIVIQERAWWDPAGAFTKTPQEKARETKTPGYNPDKGTTQLGTPKTGYKDKVYAPRGGVSGAIVKGKPETWAPVVKNDPGVSAGMQRYATLRGNAQLDKDRQANRKARRDAAADAAFDRKYADVLKNPYTEREGLGPRPKAQSAATTTRISPKPVATTPKPQPPTIQSQNVTAGGIKYERRTPTSAEFAAAKAAGGGEAGVKAAVDVAKSNQVAATSPTPDLKPESSKKKSLADTVKELQAMRKSSEERQQQ
jgi:hypothetical protein